jgi:hypothetical protein
MVPVPVNETVCGLVASTSLMVSAAVRTPAAAGLNLTLIEQLRPTPRLPPIGQLFVKLKSAGLAPRIVMLLSASGAIPTLDNVTV